AVTSSTSRLRGARRTTLTSSQRSRSEPAPPAGSRPRREGARGASRWRTRRHGPRAVLAPAVVVCETEVHIRSEEGMTLETFDDAYREYRRAVPMLVPRPS